MTRNTSIETYQTIVNNGLLSKRRLEVYQLLYNMGPMTANEVIRWYRNKYPEANQTGFNARFSELEEIGVIAVIGSKKDEISGNKCMIWSTTNAIPKKLSKSSTKKEKKKDILQRITLLGIKLPSSYKQDLRDIYHKVEEL